jgi:hypothetical protein
MNTHEKHGNPTLSQHIIIVHVQLSVKCYYWTRFNIFRRLNGCRNNDFIGTIFFGYDRNRFIRL